MMKKKMAVLAALIIIIHGFPVEAAAAVQKSVDMPEPGAVSIVKNEEALGTAVKLEEEENGNGEDGDGGISWPGDEDSGETLWPGVSVSGQVVSDFVSGQVIPEVWKTETDFLQIPSEVNVVIDPLEIDGKGQLYSERYVIRNKGTEAGTLVLFNFKCFSNGQDKAVVKTDRAEVYSSQEKAVYIEMVFDSKDRMVSRREDSGQEDCEYEILEYEIRLEPEEELVFWFEGEVNEYASQPWQDGDIAIALDYSWKKEGESTLGETDVEGEDEITGQEKGEEGTQEGDAGEVDTEDGQQGTGMKETDGETDEKTGSGDGTADGDFLETDVSKTDPGNDKSEEGQQTADAGGNVCGNITSEEGVEEPDSAGNTLEPEAAGDIYQEDAGENTGADVRGQL